MSKKNIVTTTTTTNLLLSVLSFIIILLCLNIEDAQGQQYQARSNLHFQNSLRRRADQFRQQHQHTGSVQHQQYRAGVANAPLKSKQHRRKNNGLQLVKNEVQDLPPGKYEMVALFEDKQGRNHQNDQQFHEINNFRDENNDFTKNVESFQLKNNEALLVYNPKYFEDSNSNEDRIDRAGGGGSRNPFPFKLENVYPLFPPGTSPFHAKRPRRRPLEVVHHPPPRPYNHPHIAAPPPHPHHQPKGYTPAPAHHPYVNAYKPEPDYTKPPYVGPKPAKPFSFPTPRPHTPQYQNPTPSYDDHLPYQLHPEPDYPTTPKPYKPPVEVYEPKPEPYRPAGPPPPPPYHQTSYTTAKPVTYGYTPTSPSPEYVRPPEYAYKEPEQSYQPPAIAIKPAVTPHPRPEKTYEPPYHSPYPTPTTPEPYQHPNHNYDVVAPHSVPHHVPVHHYEPQPPVQKPPHAKSPYAPPENYSPSPKPAYAPPTPEPYAPPAPPQPYTPSPKPAYAPTPKPYAPTPKIPYTPSPKPGAYAPTPKPYAPKPYSPSPKPAYAPTPKTYTYKTTTTKEPYVNQQELEPYVPSTPKPFAPTPRPQAFEPTPKPSTPITPPYEEEIYQPYKPEPEIPPYKQQHQEISKYKHFPIVEAVPYEPSAAPVTPKPQYVRPTPKSYGGNSDYRLPKKQEFSNFPANAYEGEYNDFEDSGPPKEDVKRKIQHSFGSVSNLVTPSPTEIKKNNKERQPVNPLDKLLAVAGVKENINGELESTSKPFICPHDGHFGDPDDCTKFYKCAHGTPIAEYCPATLFWNQATEQCDWPENSLCQFDPDAVKAKVLTEKNYLYLTFDDGPNEGTDFVIDALADYDVRATFFINSDNMYDPKTIKAENNQRSLLKIVDGGHILADHSFDHMSHNSKDSPQNAYTNVERDMQYFGEMNIGPVLDLLYTNGRRDMMNLNNYTLSHFIRMPYTNNWRIPSMRIEHDCSRCTVPASSGQRGIEIANRLAAQGKRVIGWDDEWGVNWNTNTLNYGGAAAYQKLNRRHTKSPNKIVLLMHDIAYRSPEASDELRTFVKLAKQSGYLFSTLDQYETDR